MHIVTFCKVCVPRYDSFICGTIFKIRSQHYSCCFDDGFGLSNAYQKLFVKLGR